MGWWQAWPFVAVLIATVAAETFRGPATVVHAKARHSVLLLQAEAASAEGGASRARLAWQSLDSDPANQVTGGAGAPGQLWTVVHPAKLPASAQLQHLFQAYEEVLQQPPEEESATRNSIKDQIYDMASDLCKDRPENAICKKLLEKHPPPPDEAQAPATAPAPPAAPVVAPAPPTAAPAPATAAPQPEAPKQTAQAPATAEDAPSQEEEGRPAEGDHLPSQGFSGPGVKHKDGETHTGDWGEEYGAQKEGEQKHSEPAHSEARGRCAREALSAVALVSLGQLLLREG